MQTEKGIQDNAELASRYLAGQLSPAELEDYERYLLEHPEAVAELEATARMKIGLANLRDTGQLDRLLRPSAGRPGWMPGLALAASLAVVFIAIVLWRGMSTSHESILVATATKLIDPSGAPLSAGATYSLLRTRSSAYDAVIELPPEPRAIALRVRPETAAPEYNAALSKIRPDGSVVPTGTATKLKPADDGFVQLYVDSSRLEASPYLLVVTPTGDDSAAATSAFRLKVVNRDGQVR
jgi:hypothetical protein